MANQMFGTMNPSAQPQQAPVQQPQYTQQVQQPQQYAQPVQQQQQQYAPQQQQPVQQPYQGAQAPSPQPVYGQPQPVPPVQAPVPPVQAPVQAPAVGTSDDTTKQIGKFISSAGLTPSQVEHEYVSLGGITESTRQALVRKHGEGTTNLLVQSMGAIHTQTQAALTATNNAVYAQVEQAFQGSATPGQTGEQSWGELRQWVATNVDLPTREAYNKMFNSRDPVQAKMAVQGMIDAYKAANGVGQTADLINGDQGGTTTATGIEDMTVANYTKQLNELVEKHGYESPQVAQLNATREAARNRGIN